MIEYNNNITYKKNFGIWFACIGFELLTCDLAPVVQEAGWSFQSFSTHSCGGSNVPTRTNPKTNYWKFQSFQDSFLGLSWWKPLSYWVQTLYKSAISRKEPRILKPSSNSGLALASITGPATDPSHQMVQEFLYLNSRYGNRATFFRAKFLKFNDACSRCACTTLLIRRYKQWYHKKSILKKWCIRILIRMYMIDSCKWICVETWESHIDVLRTLS